MTKILFLGDLFYDYKNIVDDFKSIEDYINKNDLKCILNLEGPITSNSEKNRKKRGPCLKQNISVIEILKKLNVIGVTLSNNHMCDFNEKGIKDTIKILDDNNIKHTGCGQNLQEALKPMVFNFNSDKKVSIYSYGWKLEETCYAKNNKAGCAPLIENVILNNDYEKKNINICMFHWGFEYNKYPLPKDIKLAHKVIDNGIDLIIGHHPHNIQPYEDYNNKKIFYSLGNFYFSSRNVVFNKINIDDKIRNFCNHGAGVIFDVEKKEVSNLIEFIIDNKKEKIILKDTNIILSKFPFNTVENSKYKKMVKLNKSNRNPILTGNKITDFYKISLLHIYYVLIKIKKNINTKK